MFDFQAIEIWFRHIGYKIEEALESIFGDDGRRHTDDTGEL